MIKWGLIIVAFGFLGFFFNIYTTNSFNFVIIFSLMRALQGIGTSMVQTSAYSILTLSYPTKVNFVIGCIETSAGLGLSIGPVVGALLYELGGSPAPFLTFFCICLLLGLVIKKLIVEVPTNEVKNTSESSFEMTRITYKILL
mmetsp:Transcript_19737/g.17448  ORF Transcript_19737/g.17448 Transcript_19737/m.17448 type:complete len:143 (+) Transcript_19737:423-851(+)